MSYRTPPASSVGLGKRRSTARLAAVQALYQIEQSGTPLDKVIAEFARHRFGAGVGTCAAIAGLATMTGAARGGTVRAHAPGGGPAGVSAPGE